MGKIIYGDGWKSYFKQNGLKSFDDFYYSKADMKILNSKKRYVNLLSLGQGAEQKTFFIKRFGFCHLTDILLSLRNFRRLRSQAYCEYVNANYLIKKGFGTYLPVCYSEKMFLGIEQKSFVVTEKLSGEPLDGFVFNNFGKLGRDEKEQILRTLGETIRRIHDCDISLPDLYIWHLFISQKDSGYEFSVIDLHRMKYKVSSQKEKIQNLGRLDYSLRDEYFDEGLRRIIIESYDKKNFERIFGEVRRYSANLLKRRKVKRYFKSGKITPSSGQL